MECGTIHTLKWDIVLESSSTGRDDKDHVDCSSLPSQLDFSGVFITLCFTLITNTHEYLTQLWFSDIYLAVALQIV